jgi:hypothetical protein
VSGSAAPAAAPGRAAPADAIAAYDALFDGSAGERLAADTQAALDGQLARRGLVFGEGRGHGAPAVHGAPPALPHARQHRVLMARTGALARAFAQGAPRRGRRPGAARRAAADGVEEQLLAAAAGGELASPTSRL